MVWKKLLPLATVAVLGIALGATLTGGFGNWRQEALPLDQVHAAPAPNALAAPPARVVASGLPDFADIAARNGPAVVNISVSAGTHGHSGAGPDADADDPLQEFFRRFQIPNPQGGPHGGVPVHGQGSGFIVSPDGVILTNAHVVANADEVVVKLTDRREFKAKVVGVDKPADVAVLRIEAKDLPSVRIGDPQRARVGEWVLAIGSPFGFENSATAGIVSAKSRSLPDEGYVPFLQTDVAINPGNSGGPLFNMAGEVIGINSQIYSRSGGYQGLSFAIPIDVAMKVEKQILATGTVRRGRLGVVIQELNQQLADSFSLPTAAGALVSSVEKGGPAEQAGIRAGDVILRFNDREILHSADLPPLVADLAPGSKARLRVWAKGSQRDVTVTVGEVRTTAAAEAQGADGAGLGLAARALTAPEAARMGVAGGLLVEQVSSGPAARASIRPGDILLAVNGEALASVDQLRALVTRRGVRSVALHVLRNEHRLFVPVDLGRAPPMPAPGG